MLNIKNKGLSYSKKYLTPVVIAVGVYLLSVLILWAWGNFPISDDFYYLMQVEAFSMGIFTKSALIGPTFILQAFIGLLWGKVFGITYISLRILTIVFSVLCIFGIDKILKLFNVRNGIRTLALLLVVFNPQFYACSLTFMSENYFLAFIIFSLYDFLLFTKTDKDKYLIVASLLGGLSIMIRQYGVVLFGVYIFTYFITKYSTKFNKTNIKKVLYIVVPFIFFGYLGIFWPKFSSLADPKSMDLSLFFSNFNNLVARLFNIWVIPYIGYFLLPFSIPAFVKLKKHIVISILLASTVLSFFIYKINIFSIGNLFYLEGLYARLVPNIRQNLFNNSPFKMFLAYLIAVSFLTLVYYLTTELLKLKKNIKGKKLTTLIPSLDNSQNLILILFILGFFFIVMITDRVFDRYLINFFLLLIIFSAVQAEKYNFKLGKLSVVLCIFIILVTFLITFDYYKVNQLKWNLADRLATEHGIDRYKIFIDNVYARTTYMRLTENYKGYLSVRPEDYHPYCFVQEYVNQESNIVNTIINFIEQKGLFGKQIYNPKILNAGKLAELSNRFDSTDILLFDKEYKDPMYNIMGKRTFVRAFCLRNYKEFN